MKFENQYLCIYQTYIKLLLAGRLSIDNLEHFIWWVALSHRDTYQKYYNSSKIIKFDLSNQKDLCVSYKKIIKYDMHIQGFDSSVSEILF